MSEARNRENKVTKLTKEKYIYIRRIQTRSETKIRLGPSGPKKNTAKYYC